MYIIMYDGKSKRTGVPAKRVLARALASTIRQTGSLRACWSHNLPGSALIVRAQKAMEVKEGENNKILFPMVVPAQLSKWTAGFSVYAKTTASGT